MSSVKSKKLQNPSRAQMMANFFGGTAYFAALIAWGWMFMLLMPLLLESELVDRLIPEPPSPAAPTTAVGFEAPGFIAISFSILIVLIMVAVTAYLIYKIPSRAVKKGSHLTNRAAQATTPLVLRGQKLSVKKQRVLSARLAYYFKLGLSVTPIIVILNFSYFAPQLLPIDPVICLLVAAVLSSVAIAGFWLQLVIARFNKVKLENLI